MKTWNIEKADNGTFLIKCASVSFSISGEVGGKIFNPVWRGFTNVFPIRSLAAAICSGAYYDRYYRNRLAGQLMIGAETKELKLKENGNILEISSGLRCHDLEYTQLTRVDAESGKIELIRSLKKQGPGTVKAQLFHAIDHQYDIDMSGPMVQFVYPDFDRKSRIDLFSPAEQGIWDQDSHTVSHQKNVSEPWLKTVMQGSNEYMELTSHDNAAFMCFETWASTKSKGVCLNLYGPDIILRADQEVSQRISISPGKSNITEYVFRDYSDKEKDTELEHLAASINNECGNISDNSELSQLRRELIGWKLEEYQWYLKNYEYAQSENLLKDAQRTLQAIKNNESAAMPEKGEVLYENDFKSFPHDWDIFGFGTWENDPERGFLLQPIVTNNMWTKQEFSGSYIVEFDYYPLDNNFTGGTFLQMSGACINPRDDNDFMASAMGNMNYYNFGIKCYHFSFHRGDSYQSVCNFRKTGSEFFILSQIPDPVRETERWYKLSFVKNKNRFTFYVDGKLYIEYIDEGLQGPFLDKGRIGIRNWATKSSWFRNFKVYDIA
jgi:Domain of unknown function (DUF1961)